MPTQLPSAWGAWGDVYNQLLMGDAVVRREFAQAADFEAQAQQRKAETDLLRMQVATQNRLREAFAYPQPAPGAVKTATDSDLGDVMDLADPLSQSYRSILDSMRNNQRMAQAFKSAGAFSEAEKYDQLVTQGQTNLREIGTKIYDKQRDQFKEGAQILQSVRDQDALESGISYLARNFPRPVVSKLLSNIAFDNDGRPIYDDRTQRAITNLNNEFTSADQKATIAQASANAKAAQARADQAHEDRRYAVQRADARSAANRDAVMGRTDIKRQLKEATDSEKAAQNDLNKNEVVRNYDRYAQAFYAAKNVIRQMDSGGLRDTASPDIQNMVRGYDQMINNFRSFMGGKWQAQQDEQMQGVLQKIRAYWTTIGQGKKPDKSLVRDIAAEIGRVYQDTNAAVAKRTLELRSRVYDKGGDPNTVISPAQMSEAVRTGRAHIMTDPKTGGQYMSFTIGKDKPDKEDIVPIRENAKERRAGAGASIFLEEGEEE